MHFLTAPSPLLLSPHLTPFLFFRPASITNLRRFAVLNIDFLSKGNCFYKGLCCSCSGFLRRCKDWEVEFSSLESQIFEFMQSSDKPQAFPTKEELVAAGRVDLVNAIVKEGGWLAFGWDLNNGSSEIRDFEDIGEGKIEGDKARVSGVGSNSSQIDKSTETEADESGIKSILSRLEKQRSSLVRGFREADSISSKNEDKDGWDHRTTTDAIAAGLGNCSRTYSLSPTSRHPSGSQNKYEQHRSQLGTENLRHSKPEMWRSWIIHRNGFLDAGFEDAAIVPSETQKGGMAMGDASGQPDILDGRQFSSELINRERRLYALDGNVNHIDIKSRIRRLDLELSSVLHMLRSSTDKTTMQMDQKSSSDDLAKLSDAWEFQENEIMNAQNRLRSIRAKLAVLEGKMALTVMDAHKTVEEKQRKINNAQKALQMLKTTCVVWPNNASEVFLTGSFDGWSTQRKMERLSSGGMFSVNLQLYPGRYEMKFIVDGEWKIDPLRPIVTSNGYENNLLIVSN